MLVIPLKRICVRVCLRQVKSNETKSSPSFLGSHKEVAELKKYLGRFGYVRDYTAPPAEVEHGLKQFQTFANLKVTGKLDDATMKKMSDPRCGIKDPIKLLNVTRRRKRYNHQGTTWKKEVLTWRYVFIILYDCDKIRLNKIKIS